MPGPAGPFSREERIWIVLKFGEVKSATLVRRAFQKKFPSPNPKDVPHRKVFARVLEKFEGCGDVGDPKPKFKPAESIPAAEVQAVEEYFNLHKEAHLRDAVGELGFSFGKIWFILRKILKWKPYRPHSSTVLTERHRQTRLHAAEWFLSHDVEFFSKQVIWSDEKYFVLKQGPNKSIHRYWSPVNPHTIIECKSQHQQKAMCWTGLYDGKVLGPFWIEGTMDQYVYRSLLEDMVWPLLKGVATRKQLFFMQDGATCHTTQLNLEFLLSKFAGRVISNKTDIPWPPNSPDLNPLDFFFWGYSMVHVFRIKPVTINDLKAVVHDFAHAMDADLIRKVCSSTRSRFERMLREKGGHFQHLKSNVTLDLM